jgi:serine/threonine-protein kinase
VAVKVIRRDQIESPAAWKRFLREVESARALRHPHTVELLAHGRTQAGEAYLVMERLAGTTLAARLRADGPLPAARAIKIAGQLLDAVGAAHRLGIVHRDLKPNNVLLIERDGDPDFVKVCDFGLAKAVDPGHLDGEHVPAVEMGSLATEQGQVCGTPEYMAPEQARGEALDGRADLYAVGAILFQMVVGQLPFQGRTALAVIRMHLSTPAPRPSAVRRDLEIFPALENLILRALAKDKSERPSSAAVFRADLFQIERDISRQRRKRAASGGGDRDTLSGAPAPPDTLRTGRTSRWALVAALATVVGGVVIALLIRQRPTHLEAPPSLVAPAPAAAAAVAASPPPPPREPSPGC